MSSGSGTSCSAFSTIPENAPVEDWMKVHGLGPRDDGDGPETPEAHDEEIVENAEHDVPDLDDKWNDYDWQTHRRELNITAEDIRHVDKWIEDAKVAGVTRTINYDDIDPSKLNPKQRRAYDYVVRHINKKISDLENTKPIYILQNDTC